MTLSGRAALNHPDVDTLEPAVITIVAHAIAAADKPGTTSRYTAGPARADVLGSIDYDTGAYRSVANSLAEKHRRELGLRRNGRPRNQ